MYKKYFIITKIYNNDIVPNTSKLGQLNYVPFHKSYLCATQQYDTTINYLLITITIKSILIMCSNLENVI